MRDMKGRQRGQRRVHGDVLAVRALADTLGAKAGTRVDEILSIAVVGGAVVSISYVYQ